MGGYFVEYIGIDSIKEVRRNRELLLEKYGSIEKLCKHLDEERKKLESQGWKFVTAEELSTKKQG